MASKAEIRQRVAEDLSIVPIGQTPENQDQTRIDTTFDETYQRLKEEGLASWASTAEVPAKIVPYFCLMMEERLLVTYSVSDVRANRIKVDAGDDGEKAVKRIAELIQGEYEDPYDNQDY